MFYIMILGLLGAVVFSPTHCFVIKDNQDRVIYQSPIRGERNEVILSHINSIYHERVEEVLEIKDGYFVLKEVRTDSYGVKEYYGITDGISQRVWKNITFHNSSERDFRLTFKGRPIEIIRERTNTRLTLQIRPLSLFVLVAGSDFSCLETR